MQNQWLGIILIAAAVIIGLGVSVLVSKSKVQRMASMMAFLTLALTAAVSVVVMTSGVPAFVTFIAAALCLILPSLAYFFTMSAANRKFKQVEDLMHLDRVIKSDAQLGNLFDQRIPAKSALSEVQHTPILEKVCEANVAKEASPSRTRRSTVQLEERPIIADQPKVSTTVTLRVPFAEVLRKPAHAKRGNHAKPSKDIPPVEVKSPNATQVLETKVAVAKAEDEVSAKPTVEASKNISGSISTIPTVSVEALQEMISRNTKQIYENQTSVEENIKAETVPEKKRMTSIEAFQKAESLAQLMPRIRAVATPIAKPTQTEVETKAEVALQSEPNTIKTEVRSELMEQLASALKQETKVKSEKKAKSKKKKKEESPLKAVQEVMHFEDLNDNEKTPPDVQEEYVAMNAETLVAETSVNETSKDIESAFEGISLTYEACQAKAYAFEGKGVHAVAARLFEESAYQANDETKARRALLSAIDCYLRADKVVDAQGIASELRNELEKLSPAEAMKVYTVLGMQP